MVAADIVTAMTSIWLNVKDDLNVNIDVKDFGFPIPKVFFVHQLPCPSLRFQCFTKLWLRSARLQNETNCPRAQDQKRNNKGAFW